MEDSSFKFGVIRATSIEKSNILTISELCEIAGVSRSGYYAWLSSEQKRAAREAQDAADFQQILEAYRFRGYAKGVRGIHMRLLHTGVRMNGKKIRRLMKKFGLACPIRKANPYRRMQKAIRTNNTAENLASGMGHLILSLTWGAIYSPCGSACGSNQKTRRRNCAAVIKDEIHLSDEHKPSELEV